MTKVHVIIDPYAFTYQEAGVLTERGIQIGAKPEQDQPDFTQKEINGLLFVAWSALRGKAWLDETRCKG